MRIRAQSLAAATAFAALVAAGAIAYAPGLDGVFVFDSVERIVRNDALAIDTLDSDALVGAAYAAQADYPQRGLAYVSFALDYYFAGQRFDPFSFKLTNLVIHSFNGLLVLVLAGMLLARWSRPAPHGDGTGARGRLLVLACFASGMWMLHPIQLTSVLYVVQRMTSLAGTCVFMGAIGYLLARDRFDRGLKGSLPMMYANVAVFTSIGFLFKQNALLLPALIAILEVFLFERRLAAARRRKLLWYFALTLVIPAVAVLLLLVYAGESSVSGYALRGFDMLERVLTQARVLFFYLGLLLLPDIRRFGLYHDDIAPSSGLLDPSTTLVAVLAWCLIILVTFFGARRRAPWAFAVAWFLVGHAAESSVLPLELVHEHRNYVPSAGVWIAIAYYAGVIWNRSARVRNLFPYSLAVLVVAVTVLTYLRARDWSSPALLMETMARNHPHSFRAASGYAFNSVPRNADLAVRFDAFKRAALLNDDAVSPLIEMSKIAMQLRMHLIEKEISQRAAERGAPGVGLSDMRLLADVEHADAVLAALDEAIVHRLEHAPPRTDNAVALVGVVDCSLAGHRGCVSLRPAALRWHEAALRNPHLNDGLRAVTELSIAKLHAIAGRHDEAVEHARLAGRAAGGNFAYRLEEATLYALLERWQALGEVLDEMAARFPVRAPAEPRYRNLRAQYQEQTAEQSTTR